MSNDKVKINCCLRKSIKSKNELFSSLTEILNNSKKNLKINELTLDNNNKEYTNFKTNNIRIKENMQLNYYNNEVRQMNINMFYIEKNKENNITLMEEIKLL